MSLVVCTRNRREQLTRMLPTLIGQQLTARWEVIIVDNGSSDGTSAVLDALVARNPERIRHLTESRVGLSYARNTGWQAAVGDIVAFTDDDCYPAPDFLHELLSCFDADAAPDFAGGRITLHDPLDAPVTIQLHPTPITFKPGSFVVTGDV